jgi:hypothetical protein
MIRGMTTALYLVPNPPDVPVPTGFSADDWADTQTPRPWRTIWGRQHVIDGDAVEVRLSGMQYADGTIETDDGGGPAIHINVCRDWGISTKDAREVAAAILAAADEADRLVSE